MPNRAATRLSHAERVDRVLAHLGRYLDENHDLDTLSAIAAFSPFHFHRVYRAAMGETPDDTVRRLRLDRAAGELRHGARDMASVASRAGYGSPEAFRRAFATRYGVSPENFRAAPPLAPTAKPTRQETIAMDVTLEAFPATTLIGLDHVGDYNAIGATFDRVAASAGAHGLAGPATRVFGIYFDDPESVEAGRLRSFAGFSVPDGTLAPAPLRLHAMPATRVASVTFQGPYTELRGVYDWLFGVWLPASGQEPGDSPCHEEYLNSPRDLPPAEWLTRVRLPLKG